MAFDIQQLLKPGAAHGDCTIGEVRRSYYCSKEWKALQRHYPKVQLLFKYLDGSDVPESITVDTLRVLVEQGRVKISIDDGSGGMLEEA